MRNKKCRRIIEILFILLLIVPSQPIYARAGGGGGGGGAGGGGFISSSESGCGKDGASAFDFKFIMKPRSRCLSLQAIIRMNTDRYTQR